MKLLKIIGKIFLVIGLLIMAYFSYMFIGGGFGKKPVHIKAMNESKSRFLFAHRGITDDFPENSKEAIGQAKIKGFKGLEVDIRKSSDNEFILFHDEDGKRLLGFDSKICDLSIAQIKEHHLLFNNKETGSNVMTLRELLNEHKDDFVIYYDMKLKGFEDVDEMVNLIWSYDISRSTIIASTSALLIFYIEYKYPAINTALEGFNAGKEWMYYFIPKNLKPDFFSSYAGKVDEKQIEWLTKMDLISSRIVYEVDSANYQQVIQWGLKNMIVDYDSTIRVP